MVPTNPPENLTRDRTPRSLAADHAFEHYLLLMGAPHLAFPRLLLRCVRDPE